MDRGPELSAIGDAVREAFDDIHRAREVTISASRSAIQSCAASIRATHRGEYEAAEALAGEAAEYVRAANDAVRKHPELRGGGPLHDAKKEYAEACLTLALVRDRPVPTPSDLGLEIAPYCNGLAEAASELRRQLLDRLRAGDLVRAETLMAAMDEVYTMLVTIDYPDAVTAGLRRTTDALRAVLERTRGDLTTAMVAARLQAAIEAAKGEIDG